MRNSNTTEKRGQWSTQTIDAVWAKGRIDQRYDPAVYRYDADGTWMKRSEYGMTSEFGWELDHIVAVANGGGDSLSNLQPLHWRNNRRKGDS